MEKQKYEPKILNITDSDDGKTYHFLELDRIHYEGAQYIGLFPLDEELHTSDDDFLVLRLVEKEGGSSLEQIEDRDLLVKVGLRIQEHMLETYDLDEWSPE